MISTKFRREVTTGDRKKGEGHQLFCFKPDSGYKVVHCTYTFYMPEVFHKKLMHIKSYPTLCLFWKKKTLKWFGTGFRGKSGICVVPRQQLGLRLLWLFLPRAAITYYLFLCLFLLFPFPSPLLDHELSERRCSTPYFWIAGGYDK